MNYFQRWSAWMISSPFDSLASKLKAVFMVAICFLLFWFCMGIAQYARAADLDTTDKVLFGSFVALQLVDVAQTNEAHKHPEKWEEQNPLYGSDPKMATVVAVKSAITTGVYFLSVNMNSQDRKLMLGLVNLLQLSIVAHNYSIGVRIGF